MDTIERAVAVAEQQELDADLAAEARKAAHQLAGSLGSFGLVRASELARELEERFEAGERPEGPAEPIGLALALRREIQR